MTAGVARIRAFGILRAADNTVYVHGAVRADHEQLGKPVEMVDGIALAEIVHVKLDTSFVWIGRALGTPYSVLLRFHLNRPTFVGLNGQNDDKLFIRFGAGIEQICCRLFFDMYGLDSSAP